MRTLPRGIPGPDNVGQNERLPTHRFQTAETGGRKKQPMRVDPRSFFYF